MAKKFGYGAFIKGTGRNRLSPYGTMPRYFDQYAGVGGNPWSYAMPRRRSLWNRNFAYRRIRDTSTVGYPIGPLMSTGAFYSK